jgi:hypothetical protein
MMTARVCQLLAAGEGTASRVQAAAAGDQRAETQGPQDRGRVCHGGRRHPRVRNGPGRADRGRAAMASPGSSAISSMTSSARIVIPSRVTIEPYQVNGMTILVLGVEPGPVPPRTKGSRDKPEFYIRLGASTYPAQRGDVREATRPRPASRFPGGGHRSARGDARAQPSHLGADPGRDRGAFRRPMATRPATAPCRRDRGGLWVCGTWPACG